MSEPDSLRRFVFETLPIQGRMVHLDTSWQAVLERQDYPAPVRTLLGQAMAAMALLSAMLKGEGTLTLQIHGTGSVHLLVVQCTRGLRLRGLARWHGDACSPRLKDLLGEGRLALTIEAAGTGERYQGIVPLEGDTLAACLEGYFQRSEQLPTRLWLTADHDSAAGMLLQVMPQRPHDGDAWQHLSTMADTVTDVELSTLSAAQLLRRLYPEQDVRLFKPAAVTFHCRCSRERIDSALRGLGAPEVRDILHEQGRVHVDCEFCGRGYDLDARDVGTLFSVTVAPPSSSALH